MSISFYVLDLFIWYILPTTTNSNMVPFISIFICIKITETRKFFKDDIFYLIFVHVKVNINYVLLNVIP